MFITKTGFRAEEWDSDLKEYVDKPINHIYHEIRQTCEIEEGVTLKDIIHHIAADEDLKKLIEGYAWCDVDAFWKQVQKPCIKKSDLHYIVLRRYHTIQKELKDRKTGEIFTKTGEVESSVHVNGVGPDEKGEIIDNWAIELTDVSEMADTPVKLGETVIYDENNIGNNNYKVHSGKGYFTLLEVLGEIMWELSFCGSPSDVAEKSLMLKEMVDDIKSGKATTRPWKELTDDEEKIQ